MSKDERKAYYQKNLPGFFTYPSVEFAAIVRESKAGADSVQRALKSGVKAAALLHADSLGGRMSGPIQTRQQNENGPIPEGAVRGDAPGRHPGARAGQAGRLRHPPAHLVMTAAAS